MDFVEERDFTLRLDLRCVFPDGYEGELDGYLWVRQFHECLAPRLVEALVRVIRSEPGWSVRPGNRGRALEDEVSLVIERRPD